MNSDTRGRTLELFFIDGKPDGMLTAEVFGWTGHVLKIPRTQITDGLKRKDTRYPGVYLLFGEQGSGPLLYVGEAEDVSERIRNHDSNKDWWNAAIVITSSANNLNKAHVKYLESRLIEEAQKTRKIALDNGNSPALPSLTEAARSNMEAFLENILTVLPALRIDCFLSDTRPPASKPTAIVASAVVPMFELKTPKHGISATAKLENGEFVVQAGSHARYAWEGVGSENTSYGQLHAELVRLGILVDNSTHRVFRENYAFKSPSAAAAVVNGRPANGTIEWKVKGQNMTYKQWEAEQLAHEPIEVTP
jgi:hypothetical protein